MALEIKRRFDPTLTLSDLEDTDRHNIHLGLLATILDALQWPDRTLLKCLIRGFPVVGAIPDSHVWRPVERPASVSFPEFASTNVAWVLYYMPASIEC